MNEIVTQVSIPIDVQTCKQNLCKWLSSVTTELRSAVFKEKIIHCWEKTRLLEAWDDTVQRKAIEANVYGELFGGEQEVQIIDDDEEGDMGVAILDDEPVQGLSDEATWEIVQDFVVCGN